MPHEMTRYVLRGFALRVLAVAIVVVFVCAAKSVVADTIYVSNEKDNTITIVDGKKLVAVKTIPVGPAAARHRALQG